MYWGMKFEDHNKYKVNNKHTEASSSGDENFESMDFILMRMTGMFDNRGGGPSSGGGFGGDPFDGGINLTADENGFVSSWEDEDGIMHYETIEGYNASINDDYARELSNYSYDPLLHAYAREYYEAVDANYIGGIVPLEAGANLVTEFFDGNTMIRTIDYGATMQQDIAQSGGAEITEETEALWSKYAWVVVMLIIKVGLVHCQIMPYLIRFLIQP
jgi:hypothetical protein